MVQNPEVKNIKFMPKYLSFIFALLLLSACSVDKPNEYETELTGTISDQPWQHMVDVHLSHPNLYYLDLEGGDQLVIYTKEPVSCTNVKVRGQPVMIQGTSKKPGSEEIYREKQILVEKFDCL